MIQQLSDEATEIFPGAVDFIRDENYTATASTIARNVMDWRDSRNLSDDSVEQGMKDAFTKAHSQFPGVENENTALQMLRWQAIRLRRNRMKTSIDK